MHNISIDAGSIFSDLQKLRKNAPLIHNITNFVATNSSANILLALGASPIMAHAQDELAEIAQISSALVINIGTLDNAWIASMQQAQQYALQQKIPIILDPVGAGASTLRTQTAQMLVANGIDIIRGNGSEIMALANYAMNTKGVDSSVMSEHAIIAAQQLAKQYHCIVIVSGIDDFIIDENNIVKLSNGTPLLTKVTAMGCAASAIVAAFAAINRNYFVAAAHAMAMFTITAEHAAKIAHGPGSFYINLLDKLHSLLASELSILRITNED